MRGPPFGRGAREQVRVVKRGRRRLIIFTALLLAPGVVRHPLLKVAAPAVVLALLAPLLGGVLHTPLALLVVAYYSSRTGGAILLAYRFLRRKQVDVLVWLKRYDLPYRFQLYNRLLHQFVLYGRHPYCLVPLYIPRLRKMFAYWSRPQFG